MHQEKKPSRAAVPLKISCLYSESEIGGEKYQTQTAFFPTKTACLGTG